MTDSEKLATAVLELARARKALRDCKQVLLVPAAEYVPAIVDAWNVIDEALTLNPGPGVLAAIHIIAGELSSTAPYRTDIEPCWCAMPNIMHHLTICLHRRKALATLRAAGVLL